MTLFRGKTNAPEITDGLEWVNTSVPVKIADLRGRLIILDFWTSCCINCMHVLPSLSKLEAKFGDKLAVIGVHSAKFDSERSSANILEAVRRYRIVHPVVNDSRMDVWRSYTVRAWPTLMFIDPLGKVIAKHEGEFPYENLENLLKRMFSEYEAEGLITNEPLPTPYNADLRTQAFSGQLYFPGKVEVQAGQVFISDSGNGRVIVADISGKVETVIGSGDKVHRDGLFSEASFVDPQGLASVGDTLFIADAGAHTISKADLGQKQVTTIAGTGEQSLYRHSGGENPLRFPLNSPYDILVSGDHIYIAMSGLHQIWRLSIDANEDKIEPWAGDGSEGIRDDIRLGASLAQPMGLSSLRGKLFFVDSETSAVRIASHGETGRVVTLVGTGLFDFGDRDGIGKNTLLQHPQDVAVAGDSLFIADTYNNKIKKLSLVTLRVQTVAGTSSQNLKSENSFYEPAGLCFYQGMLFVADTNNHSIKILSPEDGTIRTFELSGI